MSTPEPSTNDNPRTTPAPAQFGMLGLAVMGENLALNVADHGFSVAGWNRETAVTEKFIEKNQNTVKGELVGTNTLEEFCQSLARPRRIMMMIKAGAPIDSTIELLLPHLEKGDTLIDGGNSWFEDTLRRERDLKEKGINFIGSGVSGGAEGARRGPSLMPGGNTDAYEHVREIFEAISAKSSFGDCVAHCGPDGAGHFVKMVHNGIEYADMQLIAETYDVLRRCLGAEASELAETFDRWNQGKLASFLIEITAQILTVKDEETGKPLVDMILDKAGQKGTGKWTTQVALDLGIAVPTIAAALDARVLSSMKEERVRASERIKVPGSMRFNDDRKLFIDAVEDALFASKICAYAQGMALIRRASNEYNWNINLKEMARIWTGGCIIRASLLEEIMHAFEREPELDNLLLDETLNAQMATAQGGQWRQALAVAQTVGVPVPAMSSALAYFDSYRTARLPQNLTQAQRDFFGSHTYERTDAPERGFVHTEWTDLLGVKEASETEDATKKHADAPDSSQG